MIDHLIDRRNDLSKERKPSQPMILNVRHLALTHLGRLEERLEVRDSEVGDADRLGLALGLNCCIENVDERGGRDIGV